MAGVVNRLGLVVTDRHMLFSEDYSTRSLVENLEVGGTRARVAPGGGGRNRSCLVCHLCNFR